MARHKHQHFIPRCYLKAWCDPNTPSNQEPYVWQFKKDGTESRNKAPHKILHELDFYTTITSAGERDLTLEDKLQEIEDKFSRIRDKKLAFRRELAIEDRAILCIFVAVMHARTKARKEHHLNQWGKVLAMGEKMDAQIKAMTPERRKQTATLSQFPSHTSSTTFSLEDVRRIVARPIQEMLVTEVGVVSEILIQMNMTIFETKKSPGFITSDDPCVWFDSEAHKRPAQFRAPGLAFPTVEIRLPISPKQFLVLSWDGPSDYIMMSDFMVEEVNRITRLHAHESFIVNANIKKDYWFEIFEPPKER